LSDDTTLYLGPAVLDSATRAFVGFQTVRGGLAVSVPVTSGTPAVGTIVGSPAVFNPGDSFNSGTAFAPTAPGTSVLTVGVPAGFSAPANYRDGTATVTAPTFAIAASLRVGRDLQVRLDIYVTGPPPGPTPVTGSLPSGATSIATLSADATMAGGSTVTLNANSANSLVGSVLVQGRGLGDTTVTV